MEPKANVIVRDPEILGGIPVFRGTRVPFKNLLDYLEGGHKLDEFLEEFPSVTRQAAIAALEHAKELVIAQMRWGSSSMNVCREGAASASRVSSAAVGQLTPKSRR